MLNRVVTIHAYSIHIGLYGYIWDCVYSTLSVCLCGIVLRRNSSLHHSLRD